MRDDVLGARLPPPQVGRADPLQVACPGGRADGDAQAPVSGARAQNHRAGVAMIDRVLAAHKAAQIAREAYRAERRAFSKTVTDALADGVRATDLAQALNVTRQRVY